MRTLRRSALAAGAATALALGAATPAHALAPATLSVTFTTAAGAPLAGALVEAYDRGPDELETYGVTDAAGRATLRVPAGAYRVQVLLDNLTQWAPGQQSYEEAVPVTVAAGQSAAVTERARPFGTITGVVRDRAGAPLPNAVVGPEDGPEVNTDGGGRYRLRLPAGEYRLAVRPYEYVRQWVPGKATAEEATAFRLAHDQTVTVADEVVVPTAALAGRVLDPAGGPAAGVDVALHLAGGDSLTGARTAADGTYRIVNVPAGAYQVSFTRRGVLGVQWAPGRVDQSEAARVVLDVDRTTTLDERLLTPGAVRGTMRRADGKPLAKALVRVQTAAGYQLPTVTTDAKGGYRVAGLLPTGYKVNVVEPGTRRRQWVFGKGSESAAAVVQVAPGQTATVDDRLVAPGSVQVAARDTRSGRPVAGICAEVSSGPTVRRVCTKKSVVTLPHLAEGAYRVRVSASAAGSLYLDRLVSAAVTPGRTAKATAKMSLGGAIRTTVAARAGGRPAAATVAAFHTGSGHGAGAETDGGGVARTRAVAPGAYRLYAAPADGRLGHQWVGAKGGTGRAERAAVVRVVAGKVTAAPKVLLDKAGELTGRVTVAGTQEGVLAVLSTVPMALNGPLVDIDAVSITNPDGTYRRGGLGPYEWPLFVVAVGDPLPTAPQWSGGVADPAQAAGGKVRAGQATAFPIAAVPGTAVSGAVTGVPSESVLGAVSAAGHVVGFGTVQGGRYEMRVVGGQTVKVLAESDGAPRRWFGGTSFATATPVAVQPDGDQTLDLRFE